MRQYICDMWAYHAGHAVLVADMIKAPLLEALECGPFPEKASLVGLKEFPDEEGLYFEVIGLDANSCAQRRRRGVACPAHLITGRKCYTDSHRRHFMTPSKRIHLVPTPIVRSVIKRV